MPFADTSTGARLFYDERGQGDPLLLLHGLLGTAELHFSQVMHWLQDRYHVYGLTLRGYGPSQPKPRIFPPRFYHHDAADVLAFMDALDIEAAHVLGFSDGGETALVAATTQPQRFKSAAVIGAVGWFDPEIRPRIQRMYPGDWITNEEKALHGIADSDEFILGWVNSFKVYLDAGGDISASQAHRLTCPTLLMLGEQDGLNPAAYAQPFISAAPDARLEVFACGHGVHLEAWNDFQRVYGAFLQTAGSRSGSTR